MQRRRKKQYAWFPVVPTEVGPEVPGVTYYHNRALLNATGIERIFIESQFLLPDQTDQGSDSDTASLRDVVEGQEYIAERIVGNVWGGLAQRNAADDNWAAAIIGMGIAVMPVDDALGAISLNEDDIDPLGSDNIQNSWMWRRTWTLWNNLSPQNDILGPTGIQNHGPEYGQVDIRSVRRVKREERLALITSVYMIDLIGEGLSDVEFAWGYDLRILGAMRKARADSHFKS